jgi:hypothetical protein
MSIKIPHVSIFDREAACYLREEFVKFLWSTSCTLVTAINAVAL